MIHLLAATSSTPGIVATSFCLGLAGFAFWCSRVVARRKGRTDLPSGREYNWGLEAGMVFLALTALSMGIAFAIVTIQN